MTKKELESLRAVKCPRFVKSYPEGYMGDESTAGVWRNGFNEAIALLWPRLVALSEALRDQNEELDCYLSQFPHSCAPEGLDKQLYSAEKALKEYGVSE